jgi:hypothetical protein
MSDAVTGIISQVLPMVATALGGPLAGLAMGWFTKATGIKVSDSSEIVNAISGMDPATRATLQAKEMDFKLAMATLGVESTEHLEQMNTDIVLQVNKTMQAEAGAEHWPTYTWRPFIGFTFGAAFFVVAAICCYLAVLAVSGKQPEAMGMIPTVVSSFAALFAIPAAILGVASWKRGTMQVEDVKNGADAASQKG